MVYVEKSVSDNTSCRRVFGRCYLSVDDFKSVLLKHSNAVREYAFALHDKDTFEDDTADHKKGDLKIPHIHFCILLQYPIRAKYVGNWFKSETSVNISCQPMADIVASFEYLTHKRNLDKYQYPDSVVVCSNFSAFMADKEFTNTDTITQSLYDWLAGATLDTLVSRYGRDFIIHYDKIKKLYLDIIGGNLYND